MAGQPGYYAVVLDTGYAGIVKLPANQKPASVAGHAVKRSQYLGTTTRDILANWHQAVNDIQAYGLFELGPPGSESAIIGGGTDLGTLITTAEQKGSAILTKTPSSAEWDPAPTILAGGLGGIVSGAVRAAGEAAGVDAAGASAASGATGAAASAASTAVKAAGLSGLLGLSGDWQQLLVRALEALAGIALLLLGLQALTGTGAQGNPIAAVRSVAR